MTDIQATARPGVTETITLELFDKDGNLKQRNIVKNGGVPKIEYFASKEAQ